MLETTPELYGLFSKRIYGQNIWLLSGHIIFNTGCPSPVLVVGQPLNHGKCLCILFVILCTLCTIYGEHYPESCGILGTMCCSSLLSLGLLVA